MNQQTVDTMSIGTESEIRERYQRLLEISNDALVILQDGKIVFTNEAGVRLYGATTGEQLVGRAQDDFLLPEERAAAGHRKSELLANPQSSAVYERKHLRLNGHIINVRIAAAAVTFQGKPAVQLLVRDITEDTTVRSLVRTSEEFLRKSETQLRLIWEKSLDGMRLTDEQGVIYMVNEAYCKLVGLPREKLEGQPLSTAYDSRRSAEIITKHRERFRSNTIRVHEEKGLVLWNGRKVWFEFSNSLLEMEGQRPLNLTIFRDITERKRTEQQNNVLTTLARQLNSAMTPQQAGHIIVDAADQLFAWDACTLGLSDPIQDVLKPLVVIDTFDGKRTEISNPPDIKPSQVGREVLAGNGLIILRSPDTQPPLDTVPFGNKDRRSLSLLYAPVRHGIRSVGVFSIQSYSAHAYTNEDLTTLQALADHCGGALERLLATESLRHSEERFRKLTQSIPVGVFETDAAGANVFHNIRWHEITGTSINEDKGYEWSKAIHPDDREETLASWIETVRRGTDWIHEHRIISRSGATRWVHAIAAPIIAVNGERTGYVGTVEDITERRLVEQRTNALSKLGNQLSAARTPEDAARVISQVADDVFKWDAFSVELYSQDTERYYAVLNIDTLEGRKIPVPSTAKDNHPSARALHVMKHGAQLILKEDVDLPLGGTVAFGNGRPSASIMSVPLRRGADVLGVLSVHSYQLKAYERDDLQTLQMLADHCGGALDRIRAEEALRNSELRLQAIWESSVDGMRLTDHRGVIVAVNEAYCRLVGLKREQLENKKFTTVYWKQDQRDESVKKYRDRFESRIVEKRIVRRVTLHNDKVLDVEVTNSFIDLPNNETLLLALFRDVTAQKKLEEDLRHSQKMESIGQLAGGVAHDFNNLLTVINGHAALLLADPELPVRNAESAEQISSAAERAANLTRQLLAFSRKQIIQLRNVDMNDIVANMTKMLQRLLGEDISLQVNFFSDLPTVHADTGMLEQILLNLAVNARDAMSNGGRLYISTSCEFIDENRARQMNEARPGQFICVRVRDTGCGISTEHLPKIFEPFFTTKDVGKGTGLGLATVYGIVKQHQGWINVISKLGEGATFEVFLPVHGAAPDRVPAAIKRDVPGGRETILIVEDEPEVRGLVRSILTRVGYNCIEARSGNEALELWPKHRDKVRLLLTDVVMPDGISGKDLAEKLLADSKSLKVMYTSGYPKDALGPEFTIDDDINFIQKPYPPQKLIRAIRACLDEDTSGALETGTG